MNTTQIVAIIIATAIPLLYLYAMNALDLYKMGNFRWIIGCVFAGGVAYGLAYVTNKFVILDNALLDRSAIVRYFAPFSEEIFKALLLIYLVRRPNFTYFVDGAIYGFAAGIGFAVFENWEYILGYGDAGMTVAITRIISVNLIHAASSAMVGIAFGLSRFERSFKKLRTILVGFALAMLLHGFFNNLVDRNLIQGLLELIVGVGVSFGAAIIIGVMIKRGLAHEKVWIEEKLGAADRVTEREAAVVHRMEDLGELLEPIYDKFGSEKGDACKKFLSTQAKLGIMWKTLDKLPDEKMRAGVESQMDKIRADMDTARREVGSYVMLYIRNIFPPDSSQVWEQFERTIAKVASERPKEGGMNAFANLEERMAGFQTAQAGGDRPKPKPPGGVFGALPKEKKEDDN